MATTPDAPRPRTAGILLHPTSLPGPHGVGDLGPAAYTWLEALAQARQTWWQVLPLGPTGYGDSPYQSFSAFAGNPNLISPELLVRDGLLDTHDLGGVTFAEGEVDYEKVNPVKRNLLQRAWDRFRAGGAALLRSAFESYCERQAGWLDDFALFLALKEQAGTSWLGWPRPLVHRDPGALAEARNALRETIDCHRFAQFLFSRQWADLRGEASRRGIRLIGDVAIFVAEDSADVWANPGLFLLDGERRPTFVAGVPPDYFSATGQRWGNPLYDWEAMRRDGYTWWVARLRAALEQVDLVRLDHFRGFEAYWEIPADRPTAEVGRWVPGPGAGLLETLRAALGRLPLIAEDLGVITPEVEALRTAFGLPGMRVLQFAFGGAREDRFYPHNYERNTVVYTGTHDNDTTAGWFAGLSAGERALFQGYVPGGGEEPGWELIRLALASVADLAVAPLQDVLGLGSEARMNRPGTAWGNWRWRLRPGELTGEALDRLADLTRVYERCEPAPAAETRAG